LLPIASPSSLILALIPNSFILLPVERKRKHKHKTANMVSIAQICLRAFQFVFTLLLTALVGNAIDDQIGGSPASVNFAMFVAALCWIVVLYGLIAAFVESLAIPFVLIVLDTLATLFTLIGGIVLAARLRVHSCTNFAYLASNDLTNGSNSPTKTCRELQASTAFLWFLFAAFAASMVVSFLGSRGSFSSGRGGARVGPSMSQV